jgi:hypothetical protein
MYNGNKIMTILTQDQCREWIAALRSGEYIQGKWKLSRQKDGVTTYCCLGVVASKVLGVGNTLAGGMLRDISGNLDYLSNREQTILIRMNDTEDKDFNAIALYIEDNILPKLPVS